MMRLFLGLLFTTISTKAYCAGGFPVTTNIIFYVTLIMPLLWVSYILGYINKVFSHILFAIIIIAPYLLLIYEYLTTNIGMYTPIIYPLAYITFILLLAAASFFIAKKKAMLDIKSLTLYIIWLFMLFVLFLYFTKNTTNESIIEFILWLTAVILPYKFLIRKKKI